jgi:plastocyanin
LANDEPLGPAHLTHMAFNVGDHMTRHFLAVLALATLVACSGSSTTGPSAGGGSGGGQGSGGAPTGGGNTGGDTGGDTGGNNGGNSGGAPALTAAVAVGNIFFKSGHNGSASPAVDTVAAGGTVTWTWTNSGSVPHSVQSLGSPSFTSSAILTGDGSKYQMQFSTPGTYQYDCAVHGTMMSGTIVVQ